MPASARRSLKRSTFAGRCAVGRHCPRALREDLERLARRSPRPGRSPCGSRRSWNVGAQQHGVTLVARATARPLCSEPDRVPPHRRRPHGALQLALRPARGRRVPAPDREHRPQPRGGGVRRPDPGVARAGSDSTGTGRPPSSSTGSSGTRRSRASSSTRATPTRTRARSASACRTRADRLGRRRPRPDRVPERAARGRRPPPVGRPADVQLRARPWTTGTTGSRTSSAARTTSRTPPSRSGSSRRSARPPPRYAHVPNVLGPDGRKLSKRHGAVSVEEFRARGLRARGARQLPRAPRLEPRRRDDRHPARRARPPLHARPRRGEPGRPSTTQKLEWLNGVYLRELRAGRVRRPSCSPTCASRASTGTRRPSGAAAPLVQEKIATLGEFPAFAGFLFGPVEPDPGAARRRRPDPRGGARRARGGRAVRRRSGSRRRSAGWRAPRAEAASGVPADAARGHRLQGLAGALRVDRAPRPRGDAPPLAATVASRPA